MVSVEQCVGMLAMFLEIFLLSGWPQGTLWLLLSSYITL